MLVFCFLISSLFSFEEEFKNLIDELRLKEKYQGVGADDKTNDLIDLYEKISKRINNLEIHYSGDRFVCNDQDVHRLHILLTEEKYNFAVFSAIRGINLEDEKFPNKDFKKFLINKHKLILQDLTSNLYFIGTGNLNLAEFLKTNVIDSIVFGSTPNPDSGDSAIIFDDHQLEIVKEMKKNNVERFAGKLNKEILITILETLENQYIIRTKGMSEREKFDKTFENMINMKRK